MIEKVTKRDGLVVKFDEQKIVRAISRANNTVRESLRMDDGTIEAIAAEIAAMDGEKMAVEDIQDIVEAKLMASGHPEVAKNYILYRNERTKARERNGSIVKKIMQRVNATAVENSNANVDERSFSGREKEASADIQKMIAFDFGGLSEEASQAHKEMLIYQHDADKAVLGEHNCLFLDFNRIFTNGFKTRNGDVRSPNSFETACQLVAVAFQCQSQVQFGGVGSVHIDTDLAPYVKKSFHKYYNDGIKYLYQREDDIRKYVGDNSHIDDEIYKTKYPNAYSYAMDMLEREGSQAAEGLYHNLNTLESRQGSQVPFTSINEGRDTSTEGRLVTKWLLNASINGIGKFHLTSIFPISIFQYKQGTNASPEDPNYDLKQLAIKSMAKRIYPNWCNCDWSQAHETEDNPDTFMSTMGCRTMIGYDKHGLGYTRVGRGNNVPNTIILPKLGIEFGICTGKRAEPDLIGFWSAFEETLRLCERTLLERFAIMCKQSPGSAPFMYQNGTINDAEKCAMDVYNALKHNTLAVGYIGVAEMCQALFGVNHVHDEKVHEFAVSVVARIGEFVKEAGDRNNLNFSCYATPAESLCRTACVSLREQYGILNDITDREYITNSHHVPVWEKVSIYDKLRIEAPFCKYPTGGCITYVELDSTFVQNTKAVEDIIDYAFKELDIPYLAFNFPIDSCLDCGYQGEFNDRCPECGSENIQQLRRVTGYLTTDYRNFNDGKQAEVKDRVKHSTYTDMGGET